jgi:hypothetical protein
MNTEQRLHEIVCHCLAALHLETNLIVLPVIIIRLCRRMGHDQETTEYTQNAFFHDQTPLSLTPVEQNQAIGGLC